MVLSLKELATELGGGVLSLKPEDSARLIADVATLDTAGGVHLAYVDSQKQLSRLKGCRAAAVLVNKGLANKAREYFEGPLVAVDDARESFIAAMLRFRPPPTRKALGVSPLAMVSSSARIGSGTNIHPRAFVGDRVTIGRNCEIHPGAVISEDCVLGDGVIVYPNAVLYRDLRIGHRVIIHAGAVIGADGFGYRFVKGEYVKIPHTGTVILEEDVEIGANATVDRAMVGTTVIGRGTKIDNLVMIGHNCEIGHHNAFASQVGLAGSTRTEDYVRIAGQAGIADHLTLGEGCTIGPQAGVHADIPAGQKSLGAPAIPDKEHIRLILTLQKLPQMYRDLQALSQKMAELTSSSSSSESPSPESPEIPGGHQAAA